MYKLDFVVQKARWGGTWLRWANSRSGATPFASADDSANCILDKYEGPIVGKKAKSTYVISITIDVADEESCAQLCNSVADEECLAFSYRADRDKCYLSNTAGTDGKTICI